MKIDFRIPNFLQKDIDALIREYYLLFWRDEKMFYYSTMNEIVTSHSAVFLENGFEYIKVHFERLNDKGFDFLELKMPGALLVNTFGFFEEGYRYAY